MATAHKCPCGPCLLCRGQSSKYTHVDKLDSAQYSILYEIEKSEINKSACICSACSKQLKRNIANPNFMPRWRKSSEKENLSKCGLGNCHDYATKTTTLASCEEMQKNLGNKLSLLPLGKIQPQSPCVNSIIMFCIAN